MQMDRSWISKNRNSNEYYEGVRMFIQFTLAHGAVDDMILCPCNNCVNGRKFSRDVVHLHLLSKGFNRAYTVWYLHGEHKERTQYNFSRRRLNRRPITSHNCPSTSDTGMNTMMGELYEGFHHVPETYPDSNDEPPADTRGPDAETTRFFKYIEDSNKPLFEGASISKLDWMVRMFHLKCKNRWTNKSFDDMLEVQRVTNPNADIPKNYCETKKIVGDIGFSYQRIDACPNDCMLYMTDDDNLLDTCKTCMESRWKLGGERSIGRSLRSKSSKRAPMKVLRFFSIKKRLQRLFLSTKTAEAMIWHADGRTNDGILRHPADGEEWKKFDSHFPDFAAEPRNVRLGLSADGLDPFNKGNLSLWPVTLVVYNLPPWMCMKQSYTQMPLLIPGPNSPTNDIDVYLRPLIDELKELWNNGIAVYDVHKKEMFTLRAVLLWTINDFPAYAMLSGWSTKGYNACPICQGDTVSDRLPGTKNTYYTGHRRWLDNDHPYRRKRLQFDGTNEYRPKPPEPSGLKAFEDVQNIEVVFGKQTTHTIPKNTSNWRKNSIFNELPYWTVLCLRHNLDVMHIEKNVCELVLGTLLNTKSKTRDTLAVRHWYASKKIRPELHPISKGDGKWAIPPANYMMSADEKLKFLKVLKDLKVPDGYSSNISKCVNMKEKILMHLKSHDCHVIMQQLLPIAIRVLPDNNIVTVVTDLCHFFRDMCSKEYATSDFVVLEKKIVHILCRMEMFFPPLIFTIMLHLTIHLPREARLGGPVAYRYMYPFER